MKKILAMLLAMVLVVSAFVAVSADIVEEKIENLEAGTPGKVIVYKEDFEGATTADTWKARNASTKAGNKWNFSIAEEANGNKYAKVSDFGAAGIIAHGNAWTIDDKGVYTLKTQVRLDGELLTNGLDCAAKITYVNGKSYDLMWESFMSRNGTRSEVGMGSSGINGMAGGQMLAYNTNGDGGIKGTISQMWGSGQGWTSAAAHAMKGVSKQKTDIDGNALTDSWTRSGYTGISYALVDNNTNRKPVDSATMNGFFFQYSGSGAIIKKIMVDNKLYCGSGINGVSDTFTITEADLYGDEQKTDLAGKTYTTADLCKTWKLTEDCTPLYSEKRVAALQAAIDAEQIEFGLDNFTVQTDAMLYTDTVKVEGEGTTTVKAVTNSYLGTEETVANGGKVTVNDYYGTTYKVKTTAEIESVTYNGNEIIPGADGSIVIPAEKVTGDGELVITIGAPSAKITEFVVFSDDAEDKNANWTPNGTSGSFRKIGNNTVYSLGDWNGDAFVDLYANNKSTAAFYPRVNYSYADNELAVGTKYTLSYDYKYVDGGADLDVSMNQMYLNTNHALTAAVDGGWSNYPYINNSTADDAKIKQTYAYIVGQPGEGGWRSVSKSITFNGFGSQFKGGTTYNSSPISGATGIQAEFKGFNNADGHILWELAQGSYEMNPDDIVAAKATMKSALANHDYRILIDNLKLTAEGPAVPVTVEAQNASVKVNGVKYDGLTYVGKDYVSEIRAYAEEGYVVTGIAVNGEALEVDPDSVVSVKHTFTDNAEVTVTTRIAEYVGVKAEISGNGTIKIDGNEVATGRTAEVSKGAATKIAVTPATGNKVAFVTINGEAQDVAAAGGEFTYKFEEASEIEVVFAIQGVAGKIDIYSNDFEDDSISGFVSADPTIIVKKSDDNGGYGMVKINDANAASIIAYSRPNGMTGRIGAEFWTTQLQFTESLEFIDGKKYSFSFDAATVEGDKYSGVSWDTTVLQMKQASLWTAGATSPAREKYPGMANGGASSSRSGWTSYYSNLDFSYGITTPGDTPVYSNYIQNRTKIGRKLAAILAETKSYYGTGISSAAAAGKPEADNYGSYYKFTITKDDLYGDELGLKKNGGQFTEDELCKEWNLGMDCSPLKSEKRLAAFKKYLEGLNYGVVFDNYKVSVVAEFYDTKINISGNGTVTALPNPNEKGIDLTSTGTVKANDFYDLKLTLAPAGEKDYIYSVVYAGEEYAPVTDEETGEVYVAIPANKIGLGEVSVVFGQITNKTPIISDVKVAGKASVGETVAVSYKYEATASADASTYQWQKFVDGKWTDIEGATSKDYTIQPADDKCYIRVIINAKNADGEFWKTVESGSIFVGSIEYYVATNGKDDNVGSKDAPFATVEAAQKAIRALNEKALLPAGQVVVYIRGGEYKVSSSIVFGASDSGDEDTEIVYQAYDNEEVSFVGSDVINPSLIKKVTDKDTLDRLIEPFAKNSLYMVDLKANGIKVPAVKDGTRFYLNGAGLTKARWPNNDKTGDWFFTGGVEPSQSHYPFDAAKYNGANQPVVMQYIDEDNRSEKWTIQENNALMSGAIAYLWARTSLTIEKLDAEKKVVVTSDKSSYGQSTYTAKTDRHLYFENIFEEIDMPGEYYIDSEKGVMYFCGIGDMNNPVLSVADENVAMMSFAAASHITVDGINFREGKGSAVTIAASSDITIKNATINGFYTNGIKAGGSNITIEGCDIYDIVGNAINLSGGDRKTLESSGNVIYNNKIHSGAGTIDAVQLGGVGHKIAHNEIYDYDMGALRFANTNNLLIEYNKIYDVQLLNADGGALYWGRNPSEIGNIVRYNYFEDIGGHIGAHGQQSIFTDDGETGPYIYGNIMYHGGLPQFPLKTNGGQFHNIQNNIIIDQSVGAYMQNWSVGVTEVSNTMIPAAWWTYIQDLRSIFGGSNTNMFNEKKALMFSKEWKEYYTETEETGLWANMFDYFNEDLYNGAKKLFDANDKDGLRKYIEQNVPAGHTNFINDNLFVGVATPVTGWADVKNNLSVSLKEGQSMFENFGTDFNLSESGLAKVRETIPGFEDLDFDAMGLEYPVGGENPVVSDAFVTGSPAVGGTLVANYTFEDADGDAEGYSEIYWYAGTKADGEFTRITDGYGKYYTVGEEYEDMYIRFEIAGHDVTWKYGENVVSAPILVSGSQIVVDKTELYASIDTAIDLADNAVIGTETGTYPAAAVEDLRKAIGEARVVATNLDAKQFEVNSAVKALDAAINKFKLAENLDLEFMSIAKLLESSEGWVDKNGQPLTTEYDAEKKSITLDNSNIVRYTAEKYLNTIFNFNVRFEPVTPEEDLPVLNLPSTADTYNINGASFKVRGQNEKGEVYDKNTDFGLLVWLKNATFELQEYSPSNAVTEYTNDVFTEFNKDYNVSIGAYDAGGKTRFVFYVDDVLFGDIECATDANVGRAGFLTFRGCGTNGSKPVKMVISAPEVDKTELENVISDAKAVFGSAEQGSDYGQYAKADIDALKAVIADAEALAENDDATQLPVDRMALELAQAIVDFEVAANDTANDASGSYDINYNLNKAEFNATSNKAVEIKFEEGKAVPAIKASTVTPNGIASVEIPEGSVLYGNKITNPVLSDTASGKLPGGITVNGIYSVADSAIKSDNLVRVVLPGASGKRVYYKTEAGKYVEVKTKLSADSFAAADAEIAVPGIGKVNSGSDLVVYSSYLTEYVVFAAGAASDDSDDYVDNGGSQGGGSYAPSAGGSSTSSGFFVSDTITAGLDSSGDFVFDDMANHWAKADVMGMYNAGIVTGVTANTFEPDRNITRAEFATLIVKALSLTPEKTADFTDVKDEWFAPFVGAAAKAGIIVGADGMFRPNDTITRQEMAVIIMKAYGLLGKTAGTGAVDNFSDKADIAGWAMPYVDGAATEGIISGMGDGTFAPNANATRAQSASLISRILK